MYIDDRVALRVVSPATDDANPRAEILLDGRPTDRYVEGAILEAAVRRESLLLLFLTDDIPGEEMLRVLLLDRDLDVLDRARIGSPYATGSFSALELREPDRVSFRFIGDTIWSIRLLDAPARRLPLVSEPRGVHRPFGFRRHFVVEGSPVTES